MLAVEVLKLFFAMLNSVALTYSFVYIAVMITGRKLPLYCVEDDG